MKKILKVCLLLFLCMFILSNNLNAVFLPNEITDEMIEELIEEAEKYRDDSSLHSEDTGHSVSKRSSNPMESIVRFNTTVRKILDKSHEAHRRYQTPDIDDLKNIIKNQLDISQTIIVEERRDRNIDQMHLVFKIEEFNDEGEKIDDNIVQPVEISDGLEQYASPLHFAIKPYKFDYEDFPTREEYNSKNIEITAISISRAGEIEINIPWTDIR